MNASDAADGQSIERRLRDEHLRIALETYTAHCANARYRRLRSEGF